jgi:hypothetical protein
MPAGRPTKYSPEMLAKAQEYLDGGYLAGGKVIPSHVGLALCLGVDTQTLDNWAENPERIEFFGILKAIQATQQELLLNSGLTGEFNSAITKLVLGKHGYSEKNETTLQGQGGGPVQWQVMGIENAS